MKLGSELQDVTPLKRSPNWSMSVLTCSQKELIEESRIEAFYSIFLISDATIYKKSIFYIFFVHENMKKKSFLKLGYLKKIEDVFSTGLAAQKGPYL